jgi:ribosomal protein S18 acetylase RimI-like enzyme
VAVGKSFHRRGIAEEMVSATETLVRKQWGYDEVYLYVEQRNTPAVRLYQKLGYRKIWADETATTLLPLEGGGMKQVTTTLICM